MTIKKPGSGSHHLYAGLHPGAKERLGAAQPVIAEAMDRGAVELASAIYNTVANLLHLFHENGRQIYA
jgi:hypothetical protein